MAMNSQLLAVVQHIENERGVSREIVVMALRKAEKDYATAAEAKIIIDKFKTKEVK